MSIADLPRTDLEFAPDKYAPGPNSAEVQAKVPCPVSDGLRIPRDRYIDKDHYEAERAVWLHSWQMAARLEEIPEPGDYTEYEIVGNSVLIVRQADGSVKALHNACRHRATELAKGCGRLPGGQIVCPFHGWRWNLDGSSSYVFAEAAFDERTLEKSELALRECLVEVWAGMVWINFDHDADAFDVAMSPVKEILDQAGTSNLRVKWWKQVVLDANWKIAMEAFLEGYHVMQTHPQLILSGSEDEALRMAYGTVYTAFRGGHGRFHSPGGERASDWDYEDFIESNRLLAQGQDAMALDREVQIFEGFRNSSHGSTNEKVKAAMGALFEYAAGAGIPMSPPTEHINWGGEIFAFPNFFIFPMYANALSYRVRPYQDDPGKCIFDVWSLTTYPVGQEPERAELRGIFDKDDTENWGLIPRQDFSNIERQQRGLRSASYEGHRLSPTVESTITNLHEEIDRVIARHS
ncbi:aromatic ring-hydroxylating dioxygenase subunit alpha [Rhodococcus sp. BP-149]|uniref:aromatic ring-hydroxylating oxygenase subunit alpha n=1 Tax=unclassified Rhodococcus (in: high G+C Gram-positive bacteria) TaxID=192944 RepID=UPI001C9B2AE3|nr:MULTISPECIES: aromatic ring-hydroxylating dioxygenase subunit alpha [unclassified Rhodococcus (in: high G+C Gram-positive bacteria)]MBY6687800.1 aromatic ring-hydroxylating dioxygenase subunit alpha [Rhodococcus sp. BP-288]MBY6696065.1 aromatic ring-hydroxylating dioxygenase subunit alpha [Rhodococcus sp. BP-188]MBY6700662.1 aromatic ring-hydroxylating dioxygenase subunit alpha [Rhodococcus sp. BP-285]MBY6705059.1 aromatic ring-hydroxylating dioxygenase subunit alpha [Rhodococcus sp. BP-283]